MKTIKKVALLLCAVLLLANSAYALNPALDSNEAKKELRKEITALMKNPIMEGLNEVEASISFLINAKNEVVVLNVKTESNYIDRFIKSRLNYQEIDTRDLKKNKAYFLKVSFKNPG